jgi:hypothetical protein
VLVEPDPARHHVGGGGWKQSELLVEPLTPGREFVTHRDLVGELPLLGRASADPPSIFSDEIWPEAETAVALLTHATDCPLAKPWRDRFAAPPDTDGCVHERSHSRDVAMFIGFAGVAQRLFDPPLGEPVLAVDAFGVHPKQHCDAVHGPLDDLGWRDNLVEPGGHAGMSQVVHTRRASGEEYSAEVSAARRARSHTRR